MVAAQKGPDEGGVHSHTAPPVRGRAREFKIIGNLVAAVARGRGGVLIIEGPPGIGKSRLLAEVRAIADGAGVRTLFGEAYEYQQTVPFFPLFMATLRADPPVGDAKALRRLGASADIPYWVVHDLYSAIVVAAAQTPLAILLEDLHWADAATLLALRSLATGGENVPVLWVIAARAGGGAPGVQETLSVLERHHDAAVLRLTAMTPTAVADMVEDAVRANADTTLLNLADKAHGNPFLVMELLRGLDEEGRLSVIGGRASASGDRLPRRLRVGMQQRLDGISEAARQVVQVASVLPDRFSAGLLAAMLERQPVALVSAVDEAVRADLLIEDEEQLRFRHDLLREATRQSLPGSLRRAMERQSAGTMLQMGAAPEEVATQLARSAVVGDLVAAAALREAARTVASSDPSAAADLSLQGLQLLPAKNRQRGQVITETVVLLNRATRYDEAQHLATLSASLPADDAAQISLRLATVTKDTIRDRIAENVRVLQLPQISDLTRGRHQAWLAYNLAMHGQVGSDRTAADAPAAAPASTGDVETKILSEVTLACLDGADGYPGRALRRFEEICTLSRTEITPAHDFAELHRANMLTTVGQLKTATELSSANIEKATQERNDMAIELWSTMGGLADLAAGRLTRARAATENLPRPQLTLISVVRMAVLAQVAAHTDDRNLLVELIAEARDVVTAASPALRRMAAAVLGLAAWHRDDVHDAVRWLGGDFELLVTPLFPTVFDHLILIARVASAGGDAGLRARVLQTADVIAREQPAIALFAAVANYTRGILERDVDALSSAATTLDSSRPLLRASAAEDAGRELARIQRNPEVLDHLNTAFDLYTECQATADARRVGRLLRRLGVERRIVKRPAIRTGWDSLTDAELKVVGLVAEGASNPVVAAQLHISPDTVKTHLKKAYAKLGINSRVQLGQLARGIDPRY
jgi:DNA-binding CsgD family transcriptional regulator